MGLIVAVLPLDLIELLGIGKVAVDRDGSAVGMWDVAVQPVGHCPVEKILEPEEAISQWTTESNMENYCTILLILKAVVLWALH